MGLGRGHIIRSKCYFIPFTYRLLAPLCPVSVNSIHLRIILVLGSSVLALLRKNYKGSLPHGILVVSVEGGKGHSGGHETRVG